jgi:hypothetical protein
LDEFGFACDHKGKKEIPKFRDCPLFHAMGPKDPGLGTRIGEENTKEYRKSRPLPLSVSMFG